MFVQREEYLAAAAQRRQPTDRMHFRIMQKQNAGHDSEIFCAHIISTTHITSHIHSTSAETGENQNVAIERRQASQQGTGRR